MSKIRKPNYSKNRKAGLMTGCLIFNIVFLAGIATTIYFGAQGNGGGTTIVDQNQVFTVVFSGPGISEVQKKCIFGAKINEEMYPSIPEKQGYNIKWSVAKDANYVVTGNIKIVATYERKPDFFTVKFYVEDTLVSSQRVESGKAAQDPQLLQADFADTITRVSPNRVFNGWNTTEWEGYVDKDITVRAVLERRTYGISIYNENNVLIDSSGRPLATGTEYSMFLPFDNPLLSSLSGITIEDKHYWSVETKDINGSTILNRITAETRVLGETKVVKTNKDSVNVYYYISQSSSQYYEKVPYSYGAIFATGDAAKVLFIDKPDISIVLDRSKDYSWVGIEQYVGKSLTEDIKIYAKAVDRRLDVKVKSAVYDKNGVAISAVKDLSVPNVAYGVQLKTLQNAQFIANFEQAGYTFWKWMKNVDAAVSDVSGDFIIGESNLIFIACFKQKTFNLTFLTETGAIIDLSANTNGTESYELPIGTKFKGKTGAVEEGYYYTPKDEQVLTVNSNKKFAGVWIYSYAGVSKEIDFSSGNSTLTVEGHGYTFRPKLIDKSYSISFKYTSSGSNITLKETVNVVIGSTLDTSVYTSLGYLNDRTDLPEGKLFNGKWYSDESLTTQSDLKFVTATDGQTISVFAGYDNKKVILTLATADGLPLKELNIDYGTIFSDASTSHTEINGHPQEAGYKDGFWTAKIESTPTKINSSFRFTTNTKIYWYTGTKISHTIEFRIAKEYLTNEGSEEYISVTITKEYGTLVNSDSTSEFWASVKTDVFGVLLNPASNSIKAGYEFTAETDLVSWTNLSKLSTITANTVHYAIPRDVRKTVTFVDYYGVEIPESAIKIASGTTLTKGDSRIPSIEKMNLPDGFTCVTDAPFVDRDNKTVSIFAKVINNHSVFSPNKTPIVPTTPIV